MELKEKLVALRKEKGLTQSAVAEKLDVSRQAISRWESGIALPSTDNLKSLSALYGVPIDYLLNSDVERERDQVQTDMHCGEQAIPQRKDESMWSKTVVVGLCLLLFVLVFIIFMYLQGIEVPNVAFGLAGALIGILTKCILNSWKK